EIPRLVGRGDGQHVVELTHRDELVAARPALEHVLVVDRHIFPRPFVEPHRLCAAPREEENEKERPTSHRRYPIAPLRASKLAGRRRALHRTSRSALRTAAGRRGWAPATRARPS